MSARRVSEQAWLQQQPVVSDKISIHDLAVDANAGYDAWGRAGIQPVEISLQIGLEGTVSSAASSDALDDSTVHYGNLSKAIRNRIVQESEQWVLPDAFAHMVMEVVYAFALKSSKVAAIELMTSYPESTLQGGGSSFKVSSSPQLGVSSVVFNLTKLRIPTLIGVNARERTRKQVVTVDLWIDRLMPHVSNECHKVEQIVVKTVEESTFETLESLCESVVSRVIKYFILAKQPLKPDADAEPAGVGVKIAKPGAISRADAPSVEIYRSAHPDTAHGKRMLGELGSKRPLVPYPLEGRLDEFLQASKQD